MAEPRKWNKRGDPQCCIECEKDFKEGDTVYEDCAVMIHATCKAAYRQSLIGLGLLAPNEKSLPMTEKDGDYKPPFINKDRFLQMDLRSWHWGRTRYDVRKLLRMEP